MASDVIWALGFGIIIIIILLLVCFCLYTGRVQPHNDSYVRHHRHSRRHAYSKPRRRSDVYPCAIFRSKVIPTGVTPTSLAITEDGNYAYVANSNGYSLPNCDSVSVLDLRQGILLCTIHDTSFNEPYTVTLFADRAFVTNSGGLTITTIDTCTNQVTGLITGLNGPSGMAILNRQGLAYVNNYGAGLESGLGTTVSVINLQFGAVVSTISVALAPAAIAATPDETLVLVASYVDGNPQTGILSFIRTSTNLVTATLGGFSGPFAIAITPNGKRAVISNFGSNNFTPFGSSISIVDIAGHSIIQTLFVGIQPSGVAIDSCGKYAYVTNYNALYAGTDFTDLTFGEGTISIIDLCGPNGESRLIGPTLACAKSPGFIAIDPCHRQAYVPSYAGNCVSVIPLHDWMDRRRRQRRRPSKSLR